MEFKVFWTGLSADEKLDFAMRSGTSKGYLGLVAGGHRKAGTTLARRMVRASDGDLQLSVLRPDVWARGVQG